MGLGPFPRNPIEDMEPLPLGVPIPVPRHLASNGDRFVFLMEATCECLCEVISLFLVQLGFGFVARWVI